MTLREIFDSIKEENGDSVKYPHYLEAYQERFEHLRNENIKILEIGVQGGGSLYTWRKFFPNAEIYGVDLNPNCKVWEKHGCKIFIGDQSDEIFLNYLIKEIGPVDIIIDDGGHESDQHNISFKTLFPHLNDGGIYAVEDLHTSYWPKFGGGLNEPKSFIEFSKNLVDCVTWWAFGKNHVYQQPLKNTLEDYNTKIKSVHFYDSLVFIYKDKLEKPNPIFSEGFTESLDRGHFLDRV